MTTMVVKRGDIFYADLSPVIGSEQGGIRPVIIIQNDIGNKYSPTVIVAAITSQINKAKLPTHVEISSEEYGLNRDSVVLLEQIRTLDKKRLKERGFNQCEYIAKELSINTGIKTINTLKKIRETKVQKTLKREERIENLKDAFEIIDEKKVKGKKFILLDDVITTGATLKEGVKVLKKHGAIEIKILTLAKSYI